MQSCGCAVLVSDGRQGCYKVLQFGEETVED
jgi:hypothetical protein